MDLLRNIMIYKTSLLSLILMPFLLFCTSREELQEQIKAKEAELWDIERLVKQEEEYYQELCDKGVKICVQIMKSLTEKEQDQFKNEMCKFDADLHNLILLRSTSEPKFAGQRDNNRFDYKQLKFLIARTTLYSRKLSYTLDSYGKCAQELFMLYKQLDALSEESCSTDVETCKVL